MSAIANPHKLSRSKLNSAQRQPFALPAVQSWNCSSGLLLTPNSPVTTNTDVSLVSVHYSLYVALNSQLKGQLIHSLGMSYTPPRASLWQLPFSTKHDTSASSQLTSLFVTVFCFNNFLIICIRRLPSPPLKLQPTQSLTEVHPLVFKVLSSKTLQQEISFHQQDVMDTVTTADVEN